MGRNVSNLRPEHAPIFAFTPTDDVRRQLAICWGLLAIRIDFTEDPNASIEAAEKYLHENNLAKPGDQLVIISDILAEGSRFDCVQLRTAK
jgi:pyruvate kinase